jgi:hypothetical protein
LIQPKFSAQANPRSRRDDKSIRACTGPGWQRPTAGVTDASNGPKLIQPAFSDQANPVSSRVDGSSVTPVMLTPKSAASVLAYCTPSAGEPSPRLIQPRFSAHAKPEAIPRPLASSGPKKGC